MRKTIRSFVVGIMTLIFITTLYSFAEERITLTTYYPSPYGVYKELRADQMAIGSNYRNIPLNDGWLLVNGSVGIGTDNPGANLEVAGQVKITGGNPEANKVLTSDAVGLASWQNVGSLIKFGIATGANGSGGTSYWSHTFDINTGFSNVGDAIAIPQWATQAGHEEELQQLGVVVTGVQVNTPSNGWIRINYAVKAHWYDGDRVLDVRFVWLATGSS